MCSCLIFCLLCFGLIRLIFLDLHQSAHVVDEACHCIVGFALIIPYSRNMSIASGLVEPFSGFITYFNLGHKKSHHAEAAWWLVLCEDRLF